MKNDFINKKKSHQSLGNKTKKSANRNRQHWLLDIGKECLRKTTKCPFLDSEVSGNGHSLLTPKLIISKLRFWHDFCLK